MQPAWLDHQAYPFSPNYLEVDGGRMHYIDEGEGEPIVFVHGTPAWSFLYRHLIRDLSRDHRCIAMDHIGFGLSDKPAGWGYRFADHAANLAALIRHLGLGRFTLVVHDLGGPIGLSYALDNPGQIERLILFNTVMWPMQGEFAVPPVGRLFGTALGRLLYLRANISARALLPLVYSDRSKLTPAIHRQYTAPFPRPDDRHGMYAFAREIAAGAPSLAGLWERRAAIQDIPALLLWGMKDLAFPQPYLARWQSTMRDARTVTFPGAGHFVQEEEPAGALEAIRQFVAAPAVV
jgi:pimeloyl-ACP methyl ester carboxylesterase